MGRELTAELPDPASLRLVREAPIPVAIVTGFLGSGKTTLIRALLRDPGLEGTAVVVNEFGEAGLDHLLVESAREDTVLLEGGCLCCATHGDLVRALRSLLDRRERAELPAYRRVVVETSGLADPAPILQTLMSDPLRLSRYRLASLTATVDGLLGSDTLDRYAESSRQVALADRILITKTDLADEAQMAATVGAVRCRSLAPIEPVAWGRGNGAALFQPSLRSRTPEGDHGTHTHGPYATVTRSVDRALAWPRVEAWLANAVDRHGAELLRVKALLAIEGEEGPVLLQAVQHVVHRPERLAAWPEGMQEGRIVMIGCGLEAEALRRMVDELLG